MHLADLQQFFSMSDAVRLLRSPNAAFVVDLFSNVFPGDHRGSVLHSEFLIAIDEYRSSQIQQRSVRRPNGPLADAPETYLTAWASPPTHWLRRTIDASSGEPIYHLSKHVFAVFDFLDRSRSATGKSLGTESRLQIIVELLKDVAVRSSNEPSDRLQHLKEQQQRIGNEIAEIEAGKSVSRYSASQTRERFSTAAELLGGLQADFRLLEDRFRVMTRQIQQRQMTRATTRSEIIESALDEEALLRESDEGRSFYEFLRTIHSPERQEHLIGLISELKQIESLAGHVDLPSIEQMLPALLREAERVLQTTQHLSTVLRRLLDSKLSQQRAELSTVVGDILQLAAERSEHLPAAADPTAAFNATAEIELGFSPTPIAERLFWEPQPENTPVDIRQMVASDAERRTTFSSLTNITAIDWKALTQRTEQLVEESDEKSVSLEEVLVQYPPTCGIVEVLAYIQLAYEGNQFVDLLTHQHVSIWSDGHRLDLRIPDVRFSCSEWAQSPAATR
jgi:hypothetical protein